MSRTGIYRFFVKNGPVHCPDCGEQTLFRSGSLLGSLSPQNEVVVVERLLSDLLLHQPLRCTNHQCGMTDKMYLWVSPDNERVHGPLCQYCFKMLYHIASGEAQNRDAHVYYLPMNERVQNELERLHKYFLDDNITAEDVNALINTSHLL